MLGIHIDEENVSTLPKRLAKHLMNQHMFKGPWALITSLSLPILPLIKPYDFYPLKLQNVLALTYIRDLFIRLIRRNFYFTINKIIHLFLLDNTYTFF